MVVSVDFFYQQVAGCLGKAPQVLAAMKVYKGAGQEIREVCLVCLCVCMCVCMHVCELVSLSVCVFVCIFMWLSVCGGRGREVGLVDTLKEQMCSAICMSVLLIPIENEPVGENGYATLTIQCCVCSGYSPSLYSTFP